MDKINELKEATKLYRAAPKDVQMYFNTLLNLAVILFKATRETPQSNQKGS